jgi:hypothetical protein
LGEGEGDEEEKKGGNGGPSEKVFVFHELAPGLDGGFLLLEKPPRVKAEVRGKRGRLLRKARIFQHYCKMTSCFAAARRRRRREKTAPAGLPFKICLEITFIIPYSGVSKYIRKECEMKMQNLFSAADRKQIEAQGLTLEEVKQQLALYARGPRYIKLLRPCTLGDGIVPITPAARKKLIRRFDEEAACQRMMKFVPASGAASRMFAGWHEAARRGGFESAEEEAAFYDRLRQLPFASLIAGRGAGHYLKRKDTAGLLSYILSEEGLHYGWLPKALISFHAYPGGEVRTALEEHLAEAASFLCDGEGNCRLHVTLSEEHIEKVYAKLDEIQEKYERMFRTRLRVEHSVQLPSTAILAVDEEGRPFRGEDGRLVFRPGGHGALLQNLAALDAEFIFVKNIDNIVPQNILSRILPYKKMLGGLALDMRQSIFTWLKKLKTNDVGRDEIDACAGFCRERLNLALPESFDRLASAQKRKRLASVLNRPLRVCGMVRNEGEPGGGPFWVEEPHGAVSVQIVEAAHVDPRERRQQTVWRRAAFFNPVDMVCCIRDDQGRPYDLQKFVNRDTYLISAKTEKGRRLLALERPGLWNGAMAYWNTVFVELPLAVFNPVKTVEDLLRPQHRAGRTMRRKAC